tara:strand:- start:1384 stop:2100 length:717 start_codon:yes stop_codon:yes gene_type:complete
MIDFKTHIKLFKEFNSEKDIESYLNSLDVLDRLQTSRDIKETYPIDEKAAVTEYIFDNFNVTLGVEQAVLGQFIMLEQIITGKTNFESQNQRDLEFAKLILRPKHHKEFDNENENDEKENEQNILSSPVQDIYSVVNTYLENRDYVLFKQFSGVFYEIPDEDEETQEEDLDNKTNENLFHSQWYWYSMVRMLAKEDVTRYEEIYMLKMSTVLPEMSYITQKEKIDRVQTRRQESMNKL